ncbi:MAG: helix-turn-helix transcriptional regulator [Desulfovibrionaceae bacterium]|nr:helix-turn-helix transcriptional regulator [Desulfovibrionaceae bacterium]
MPFLNDAFRQILRAYRENAGLTQKELAEKIDASLAAIKKLEHGDRVPSLRTVLALCRGLGVKPHDFITDIVRKLAFLEGQD